MPQEFQSIHPTEITDNTFKLLDKDWMLVTAGNLKHFNTMTASWGHLGIMWNVPTAIVYIRPQRYTYEFANKYPNLDWDKRVVNRPEFPMLKLPLQKFMHVKFNHIPVLEMAKQLNEE